MAQITKEVQISALADQKMRAQIGAVCVHASLLELMVERVIANLQGMAGIVTYAEDLGHRLDTLKDVAKASALPVDDKKALVEIAGRIKTLLRDRHRVIHGLWGLQTDMSFVSIFPRAKHGDQDRPMDFEAIRQVKLRIWAEHEALRPFADQAQSVVIASRQKSRKAARPNPPGP